MPSIETSVVSTDSEFQSLRDSWRELFASSNASIFQSWEWCDNWWRTYGRRKRLAVVLAKENERLIAIAPLYVSRSYGPLPTRVAAFLGTGSIDCGGLIVRAATPAVGLETLMEELTRLAGADCLDLHQVDATSPLLTGTSAHDATTGLLAKLTQESCYRLPLDSVSAGLGHLSKKFRDNLKYSERRLLRDHTMELEIVEDADDLAQAMSDFFHLHKLRWRTKRLPGSFATEKRRGFHMRLAADLLAEGHLLLSFLRVDGRRVASVYGFQDRNKVYYYQGGFDPEWSRDSVSSLLLKELVLWAARGDFICFDFLRGNEPYKLRWGAREEEQSRLIVGEKGARSGLASTALALENKVVLRAKALAQRI